MKEKINIDIWKEDMKDSSSGFKVPGSYFNNLENSILSKTSQIDNNSNTKLIQMNKWIMMSMATAAALIIAFFFLYPKGEYLPSEMAYENEIEQYAFYDEDWIAQELAELSTGQEDIASDAEIDFLLADGVTNDEILDIYLNN